MVGTAAVTAPVRTVALLHWGDVIEDFLDQIGVSLETFTDEVTGGWMFGYVEALRTAGVETVLVCVSGRVRRTEHRRHRPTGALVCVLPAGRLHSQLRRWLPERYAWGLRDALGQAGGWRRALAFAARQAAPYLATPPRALARELRRHGCQAILCQEYEHPRFDVCVLLGAGARLRVHATFQGGDAPLTVLERPLRQLTMRMADGFVIGAQREVDRVRHRYGVPAPRIAHVGNPFDLAGWDAIAEPGGQPPGGGAPGDSGLRAALGIPDDALVVAWHGRVEERRKGLDVLLDAWEALSASRAAEQAWLLLVGTGSDAPRLHRSAAERGLSRIRWVDEYVTDRRRVRRHLDAADVYAFPSRHEGFPVAPLEAMACGLPIVAADAPGVADILPQGEGSGGLVVPPGDAAAFGAALGRLLGDAALRETLGRRARERVRAFSPEAVGARLATLLRS